LIDEVIEDFIFQGPARGICTLKFVLRVKLDDGPQKSGFTAEVALNQGFVEPGELGNRFGGGSVETDFRKDLKGGVQKALRAFGPVAFFDRRVFGCFLERERLVKLQETLLS
jgi:hypothetical protein